MGPRLSQFDRRKRRKRRRKKRAFLLVAVAFSIFSHVMAGGGRRIRKKWRRMEQSGYKTIAVSRMISSPLFLLLASFSSFRSKELFFFLFDLA